MKMCKKLISTFVMIQVIFASVATTANCAPIRRLHQQKIRANTINSTFKATNKNLRKDYDYYRNLDSSQYEEELKDWYKRRTKKELDLENPKTFNEKVQWLKLYDSTPIKTKLADKYLVREWVKEKIGEEYLVPLLGAWDKFDDIDFDKLPDKFVLKCNHGCGWNLIVTDKSKIDKVEAKKKFDKWMNTDFAFCNGLELHYKNIQPKIIAEEYLENNGGDLYDYKVLNFNSSPEYILFVCDRKSGSQKVMFDKKWRKLPFYATKINDELLPPRPQKLNKLLELSKKLSEGFPFVRVDFYILNDGSIKFSEMTFTPASGQCKWNEDKYDKILGEKITLPKEKYDYHKLFENN